MGAGLALGVGLGQHTGSQGQGWDNVPEELGDSKADLGGARGPLRLGFRGLSL